MLDYLSRHWWAVAVRGGLAIAFGILAVAWPGVTLVALAILFGAYALVNGVIEAVAAFRAHGRHRTPLIVEAVLSIGLGLITLFWPGITIIAMTILIGIWAVVTGVAQIIAAVRLRQELTGEWLLILSGALSVVFGVILLFWPGTGAAAVAWILGIYAMIFGFALVFASLKLRRLGEAARTAEGPREGQRQQRR
ncbi:MAG: HdeD family acid-resistance protein [Streptosporangiaceae bacterium]